MLPVRAAAPVVPDFTPVPRRPRSDGWTENRQRGFIASLAATGSVAVAADSVGLCVSGAYRLRSEPGGASFVRAWNEALDTGIAALKTVAFDRAVNGVPVTLFYHGEPAATTTRHDNRLLMSLLRHYDRPGAPAPDRGGAPESTTDMATTMWLHAINQVGLHEWRQAVHSEILDVLLKVKKHPGFLDDAIQASAYGVRQAQVSLDHCLRQSNEGPEGMRKAAATVHEKPRLYTPSAAVRSRANKVLAYLHGEGPPLEIARRPLPPGAPEIRIDPIPWS